MKKTLIVLMLVLLSAMLMVSCDDSKNDSGDSGPKTINIKYDVNKGALAKDGTYPSTATTGDVITPTAPTRGGGSSTVTEYDSFKYESATLTTTYTFKGWKVEGSADSTAKDSYTAEKKDVTLVAVWEVKTAISDAKGIKLSKNVKAGAEVTLGKYNDSYGNDEGVKWTVLTVDSTSKKALLFASNVIGDVKQQSLNSNSYSWTSSLIKFWLNNDESDGFISQYGLSEVKMETPDSSVGKVFLLSEAERNLYSGKIPYLSATWWLRDPDNDSQHTDGAYCKYVTSGGSLAAYRVDYYIDVRPAFWISISD